MICVGFIASKAYAGTVRCLSISVVFPLLVGLTTPHNGMSSENAIANTEIARQIQSELEQMSYKKAMIPTDICKALVERFPSRLQWLVIFEGECKVKYQVNYYEWHSEFIKNPVFQVLVLNYVFYALELANTAKYADFYLVGLEKQDELFNGNVNEYKNTLSKRVYRDCIAKWNDASYDDALLLAALFFSDRSNDTAKVFYNSIKNGQAKYCETYLVIATVFRAALSDDEERNIIVHAMSAIHGSSIYGDNYLKVFNLSRVVSDNSIVSYLNEEEILAFLKQSIFLFIGEQIGEQSDTQWMLSLLGYSNSEVKAILRQCAGL